MTDKVQLIKKEIERRMHFIDGMVNTDFRGGVLDTLNKLKDFIDSLPNEWIKIDKKHPLPKFEEVLGFNEEWIEADFNPKGVRIGYLTDEGNFISAKYEPDGEDYISMHEEGDDYEFFQTMEDGANRPWYNNGDDRGDIEGYRPNLPTYYKRINGLEED